MILLLNKILREPFALLGIFFLIIGAASLLFKVFSFKETGNKQANRNGRQILNKAFVFILIAILIAVIVFIFWLNNKYS